MKWFTKGVIGFFVISCVFSIPLASAKPDNECGCGTEAKVSKAGRAGKLVNPQEIMKGFEQGQEKVKIIVNLAESPEIKSKVRWKSKASLQEFQDKIKAIQLPVLSNLDEKEFKLRHRFENQAGFSGEVTVEALEKLIANPVVQSIEPVCELHMHLNQGIPLIAGDTYRSTYNGQGISIAICDTGIDYTHPRLGNGSWGNVSDKVIGGWDFGDNDDNPLDSNGHGTACAGIAAGGLGTNVDYIGGVAYNAKIYALKVFEGSGSSCSTAYCDNVVAAWNWCITHWNDEPGYPIKVISTSIGGFQALATCDTWHPSMTTAANNAVAARITVLASSGNDGFCNAISYPACISNVISVGAVYDASFGYYYPCVSSTSCASKTAGGGCPTGYYASDLTSADMVTSYSNTASFLDILAPSNRAYTTDIVGSGGYSGGDYDTSFGGTSAACPYAAGAVACLQEAALDLTGDYLTPDQVRATLANTGDSITDGKVAITKPRINLASAIESLGGQNNIPFLYNGWVLPQSGTTVTDFEYTVNYLDTDGDVPDYVRVYIDGNPHDMTLWNGTAASGEYRYVTQLSSGSHHYYFTTADIRGGYQQTVTYTGPSVDVPPPGSFVILDRLINDSYELASYNNQDGVIQSGEVIGIRPRIKFDESASVTATRIDITLSGDNPSLEVWSGDRRYPDMAPGDIRYPADGKYIQVVVDKDCQGTYYLDADLEWEEDDIELNEHFPNAIELNIEPAPWLNLINEEWDFGVAKPGDIVNYSLTVRNIGTGVLQVTAINSLGDTTAVPSAFSLAAGASQNVQVSINTTSIPSGTRITRDVYVISNGRSDEPAQDEHLIITGLVSDTLPIYKIPTIANGASYPDISGSWIVWHEDRNGDGTWDILAYNVSTGEEITIPSSQYHQGNPNISGNLIAWRDSRNWNGSGAWTDQSDVYGYDLNTGQEFAICNGPGKDYVVGVSGNLIAVASCYETIYDQGAYFEDAYNLLAFQYLGNGQCSQIYSTGYTPGSGTQTRPTLYSNDSDFGGGLLVFEIGEIYWEAEYDYWNSGHRNTYKIDFASGESAPSMISTIGSGPSDYSAASHEFVYLEDDYEGDDVVWLWLGNTQITPSLGIDYGDDCLAFNGTHIVYDKYPDAHLFYWDRNTSQEKLVTNQLLDEDDARMDGNGLVWRGMDADSQWYLYFTYFDLPDVSVSSTNINFSNYTPIEGTSIDISVLVQNTTDYPCTNDITVKLFDGDPDIAGAQLGTDYTIVGGISANGESLAPFTNIPVGLEGCHEVFVRLQVDGMDIYANNKASKILTVGDADTQGPVISNVTVQEFNGNGDGRIEDNEQIWISWQATDSSGINSSWCTIDSNDYPASGTYYVILAPRPVGTYSFTISATDGDLSPETKQDSGYFTVSFYGDINEDGGVNFEDFAILASHWLETCSEPDYCEGADIDHSGGVGLEDIQILCEHWLKVMGINDGLVAHWTFDEGSGNTVHDYSGNEINGEIHGGVLWIDGVSGKALDFNGADGYVDFGNAVGNFGTGDFSIFFWLRTNTDRDETLMGKRVFCGEHSFWELNMSEGPAEPGCLLVELYQGPPSIHGSFYSEHRLDDNQWHLVAITRQGVEAKLYIDGIFDNSSSSAEVINMSNNASLFIGRGPCIPVHADFFSGELDEARIYDRALTPAEIEYLYENP